MGKDTVFEDIRSGDLTKIVIRKVIWRKEGIEYLESTDEAKKYKLKMLVHNMNDLLFAHLFQASNFGNGKINGDKTYGTMESYAGHMEHTKVFPWKMQIDNSNFLNVIAALKEQAEKQRQLGHQYMRVATTSIKGVTVGGFIHSGHAENIDIDALLALNPENMETGKAYAIGDRNWAANDILQDIPRLAVRKVNDAPPTYEFGTLHGSRFEKNAISYLEIDSTDVHVRDAQYWEQFRP
ncbi:MAG: hypothetical protein LBD34_00245 [Puniceicoccales bacterium]|jgi:hypothetical protein|nr:hypothetical protein [Puniceicoccales bacterium]